MASTNPTDSFQPFVLSEEEQQIVSELQDIAQYPKGTILVSEGQFTNKCYHIIKGCIRKYHLKDGEEKTTDFFTEEDSITVTPGGSKPMGAKFNLQCVEDTTVSMINAEQEAELYAKFPRFQSMCRISTEQKLEEYQEKLATFISSTPEERYSNLLATRPDLLNRVPQYQLASYLGVKPETLSRIRKRLSSLS